MSTLLPLFWMTVGKPLELANAPSAMALKPETILVAVLSLVVPFTCDWFMVVVNVSVPPRD